MPEFPAAVQDLLARQDNVVTRAQLLQHGLSCSAVRWNAGRAWRGGASAGVRHRPRATLASTAPDRRPPWAGPEICSLRGDAARLHGITSADPLPGARPRARTPDQPDERLAEVRRTLLHDPGTVRRGPLRLSSPARSAVDAARAVRTEDARAAILIEAVQRGIATLDDLEEWVLRLRPRDAAPLRGPLAEARHPARGPCPRPTCSTSWRPRPCSRWPGPTRPLTTGPGQAHHSRRLVRRRRPRGHGALAASPQRGGPVGRHGRRDGDLVAAGVVVAGATPRRLRRQPDAVLTRLERAYLTAAARPRPGIRATPRHLLQHPKTPVTERYSL